MRKVLMNIGFAIALSMVGPLSSGSGRKARYAKKIHIKYLFE